jgi:hypothetical protein
MWRIPLKEKVSFYEEDHRVKTFRRMLRPEEGSGRKDTLVQFWAVYGGLRTIRVADIIDVI